MRGKFSPVTGLPERCRPYSWTVNVGRTLLVGVCLLSAVGTGAAAASRLAPAPAPPAPSFRVAAGWVVVKRSPSESDVSRSDVWVITKPNVAVIPIRLFTSLTHLSPRGIAIWSQTTFPRGGPTHGFTPATLPLRLSSFRVNKAGRASRTHPHSATPPHRDHSRLAHLCPCLLRYRAPRRATAQSGSGGTRPTPSTSLPLTAVYGRAASARNFLVACGVAVASCA